MTIHHFHKEQSRLPSKLFFSCEVLIMTMQNRNRMSSNLLKQCRERLNKNRENKYMYYFFTSCIKSRVVKSLLEDIEEGAQVPWSPTAAMWMLVRLFLKQSSEGKTSTDFPLFQIPKVVCVACMWLYLRVINVIESTNRLKRAKR